MQANIHTAHARKPLASLMDYFKRKKNVLVRQNCIHFSFLIAMSFWNSTALSFYQHLL